MNSTTNNDKLAKASFTKVNVWRTCPRQYQYRYIERAQVRKATRKTVRAARDLSVASPRVLGKTLDLMLKDGAEAGLAWYFSLFKEVTEKHRTQAMLLEYWYMKLTRELSDGEFQVDVVSDRLQGSIDWLSDDGTTLVDIKLTCNPLYYWEDDGLQLMLYASELPTTPEYLGFLCVPRVNLSQKPGEDLKAYRLRLLEHAEKKGISLEWKEYDQEIVDRFWADMEELRKATTFEKHKGDWCEKCEFRGLCRGKGSGQGRQEEPI